jgi:hypothetical protein
MRSRGEALVVDSVAGTDPESGERTKVEGFGRFMTGVPLLVRMPGRESYELTKKLWMKREKYPIAGTTLPVDADAGDPTAIEVLWDEVPEIDDWIAQCHPVFSDPDRVEAALRAELADHRARARTNTLHETLDGEAAHAVADRLRASLDAEAPAPPEPVRLPPDRASGRVLAASPRDGSAMTWGEVLLSVHVPGEPRRGARWRGYLPPGRWIPTWTDVPIEVGRRGKIEIGWDEVSDGLGVVTERLQEAAGRLEAQLSGGFGAADAQRFLAAAAPAAIANAAAADPLDELERLARLRDAGVLTDTQFAAEKARLLNT